MDWVTHQAAWEHSSTATLQKMTRCRTMGPGREA